MAATGTPTPNLGLRIPLGTDPASVDDINYNSNTLDTVIGDIGETSVAGQLSATNNRISAVQDGLAIVCNGNTHAAIEAGQFAYVKNHGTLAEGLYRNNTGSTIAANATLSSSNLTADTSGGLNTVYDALNSKIVSLETPVRINQSDFLTLTPGFTLDEFYAFKLGKIVNVSVTVSIDSGYYQYGHIPFTIKSPYIPKVDVIRNAPYRGGAFSITADGRLWVYPIGNTDTNIICWLEYFTE